MEGEVHTHPSPGSAVTLDQARKERPTSKATEPLFPRAGCDSIGCEALSEEKHCQSRDTVTLCLLRMAD